MLEEYTIEDLKKSAIITTNEGMQNVPSVLSLRQLARSLDRNESEFESDSQKGTVLPTGFKGVNYQSSREPSAFPDARVLWGWGVPTELHQDEGLPQQHQRGDRQ